ncbi:hypothetical protein [Hymenobacter wooponensis]|uniref:Polysaccharide biosynthesis protein C-terminal domain-containing protein n=1 Tax=Hymenobacter wooponensis TaxID=1525360 RepID=A0A4Z0MQW9_9BACT|nr:hypothetical protein [Hymenobacter wooponensis]TGD82223.1 hypothetical protein EU557_00050 [Hymenobacter wooponensis]
MSTASRLISGSAASWVQIGVTVISQMALVPLYLSHWSVVTFGVWIAIQTLGSVISILDLGHQEFLAYEFLRIGTTRRPALSRHLWSGISIGILLSLVQLLIITGLLVTGALPYFLGKTDVANPALIRDAGIVLLLQGITWLICTSMSGLFFRALAPFGYYPRMAWWGLAYSVACSVAPVAAVLLGAGLLITGIVTAVTGLVIALPLYLDLFRLLRQEQVRFVRPSLRLGVKNFVRSLAITGRVLLENARQQGVRLLLAPLAGAAGLAAFSTMRTGANVALQGLNTVVNPMMPELMRFLHQRDQARSEVAFGTIWFVLVAVMAPATVVFQAVVEPLYALWTRGKVPFDPILFATLSLTVLVYAVVQPAMAVVRGNNLLRPQLLLSAAAAAVVVGGIVALVPLTGILGGGLALLAAEVVATIGYRVVAGQWLRANGLHWPARPFQIALASVWMAALAMGAMIMLPQLKWLILLTSLVLLLGNAWRYWQVLPTLATEHTIRMVSALPLVKKLFPA